MADEVAGGVVAELRPRCTGLNREGKPCGRLATDGTGRCGHHGGVRRGSWRRDKRSLPRERRRAIIGELPPRQCKARSKQTGQQCRRQALLGAAVCVRHGGGAPQVRAAAARRVTIAELLTGEGRPPRQVLADAIKIMDGLMTKEVAAAVSHGEPLPLDLYDRLVDATSRAAALAKVGADLQLEERAASLNEAHGQAISTVLRNALTRLGVQLDGEATEVVVAELRQVDAAGGPRRVEGPRSGSSWFDRRVQAEVARRLADVAGPRLAIGAGASSPVSGPEPDPAEPGPGLDRGLSPAEAEILAQGPNGDIRSAPVDAVGEEPETIVAEVVDEVPVRCRRCGRTAGPWHNPTCSGVVSPVFGG